jgi:hypothetical protein
VGVFYSFETVDKAHTGEKRDGSEDAETAVDQTPEQGMPRSGPAIRARGMTEAQAITPN